VFLGILIALTCIAYADQPVPAVPETQGLVTTTSGDVVGMATETDTGVWTLTNDPQFYVLTNDGSAGHWVYGPALTRQLYAGGGSYIGNSEGNLTQVILPVSMVNEQMIGAPDGWTWGSQMADMVLDGFTQALVGGGIHSGALDPGQIQYTTAYDAGIVAQAGHTVLLKSMNINTGNKVLPQSNLAADTVLTFVATGDGGNVVGSENLLIDGAGNTTKASDRMLCPFASQPVDVIPAYCNIVQTGNAYDLTVGSVTSHMSERFVSSDATNPVQLDHEFNVKPYGTTDSSIPAIGSASAYFKAHIQEARDANNTTIMKTTHSGELTYPVTVATTPLKAEDLQYSESSSVSGIIQQFTKVVHYQSGKSLMP